MSNMRVVARWIEIGGAGAAVLAAALALVGLAVSLIWLEWPYWVLYLLAFVLFGGIARARIKRLRTKER